MAQANQSDSPTDARTTVRGRDDIATAYRDEKLVADYVSSRYQRDPFGSEVHRCQARVLRKLVEASGARRLLEVACGPGRVTVEIPPVEHAFAVDQSPAMLEEARRRLDEEGLTHWQLEQADAFDLRFDDGAFDILITLKLVRHFDRAHRGRLLKEFHRVLAPRGALVLDVPSSRAYPWLYEKWGVAGSWVDDYVHTKEEFVQEAKEHGFVVEQMLPVHSLVKIQHYLFGYLHPRLPGLANAVSRAVTQVTDSDPYEWMALCRRA